MKRHGAVRQGIRTRSGRVLQFPDVADASGARSSHPVRRSRCWTPASRLRRSISTHRYAELPALMVTQRIGADPIFSAIQIRNTQKHYRGTSQKSPTGVNTVPLRGRTYHRRHDL